MNSYPEDFKEVIPIVNLVEKIKLNLLLKFNKLKLSGRVIH
jgi:hypothetical protein